VRTAFHDAVARFGGAVLPRTSVVFSSSATSHATSDIPVAHRQPARLNIDTQDFEEPRPTHYARRESYGATPARDAFVLCSPPIALAGEGTMQHDT
jgi:hypothetical protein